MGNELACQVNIHEMGEIIQHIRDLINIYDMIGEESFNEELTKTIKAATEIGWSKEYIRNMLTLATYGTRYEQFLPFIIPERGDYWEWRRNLGRKI